MKMNRHIHIGNNRMQGECNFFIVKKFMFWWTVIVDQYMDCEAPYTVVKTFKTVEILVDYLVNQRKEMLKQRIIRIGDFVFNNANIGKAKIHLFIDKQKNTDSTIKELRKRELLYFWEAHKIFWKFYWCKGKYLGAMNLDREEAKGWAKFFVMMNVNMQEQKAKDKLKKKEIKKIRYDAKKLRKWEKKHGRP